MILPFVEIGFSIFRCYNDLSYFILKPVITVIKSYKLSFVQLYKQIIKVILWLNSFLQTFNFCTVFDYSKSKIKNSKRIPRTLPFSCHLFLRNFSSFASNASWCLPNQYWFHYWCMDYICITKSAASRNKEGIYCNNWK